MINKKQGHLKCKDYTVSGELFDLILDEDYEMLVTSPKPKPEDLGKYYESESYISHTDSNLSITDKVYQWVKEYAIKSKIKLLNSLGTQEKNILDIGCGTGDFLVGCKKKGWSVFGVEPNAKARDLTLKKLIENNDSIENTIEENINEFLDNGPLVKQFDVITMWHVLEHVPNLNEYIESLKKLLKPSGVLLIAVPNFKSYDANHYNECWAAYDVPRHLSHFSQKSIKLLFDRVEMKVSNILPMKFDAYYVSLLSEKYKSGSPNPFKAFYHGFVSNLKAKRTNEYSSLIYIIKSTNSDLKAI